MTTLRSALFLLVAFMFSVLLAILLLPALIVPRRRFQELAALWCKGLITLLEICCGLRWRLVGSEYIPEGAAIIASKHQSAWDTLIFHTLLKDPVYVLKRELLFVPLLGLYLRKAGSIAIDRASGFRSLKAMLPEVDRALSQGAKVIVFPEGTRTAPGGRVSYQPGIAALYSRFRAPVVPVALNSGLFWARRQFIKRPGVITIQVLPPVPPGLHRVDFLACLEARIEEATAHLYVEGIDQQSGL